MSDNNTLVDSAAKQLGQEIGVNVTSLIMKAVMACGVQIVKNDLLRQGSANFQEWILKNYGKVDLYLANRQIDVDKLHVELKLTNSARSKSFKSKVQVLKELESGTVEIEKYFTALEILNISSSTNNYSSGNDIIIVGTAGSGKTTTFKNIAVQVARGREIRGFKRVPFLVTLRSMPEEGTLYQCMLETAKAFFFLDAELFLESLLKSGKCLLLIDGFDEVKKERRADIYKEIMRLRTYGINSEANNVFCLSGRPEMLDIQYEDFNKYQVMPFDEKNKIDFIYKWFGPSEFEKAKKLTLHLRHNPSLPGLAESPLLLSIVCALYYRDFDIPREKYQLFEHCIDGLAGKWDDYRNIDRGSSIEGLDKSDRIKALSVIANKTLEDERQIVFGPKDLVISNALKVIVEELGMNIPNEEILLTYFHNDYSLLVEQAYQQYSFFHLQFQEYLCAKYIVESREELDFLDRISGQITSWEYPLRYIAKHIMKPYIFLKKLWAIIDKNRNKEVYLFTAVLSEKPTIKAELIFEIVRDDLSGIIIYYRKMSASVEIAYNRLVLNGFKGDDVELMSYFALIDLRNHLSVVANQLGIDMKDGLSAGYIKNILVCNGNSNKIHKVGPSYT